MIPLLLLAAGRSSRMRGADKLAEEVGGEPLLTRTARAACAATAPVFVALPALDHPRAALMAGLEVTPLALPGSAEGLGGTVREGVAALPACPAFLILAADLPLIEAADITALLAARAAHPEALIWRGATPEGKGGHPLLFDASLRPAFAKLEGDTGAAPIVRANRARTHLVRYADDRALLDLDTPEDWAAFRSR
ncbi:NTP transferase domain-containing protein [Pseudoroseicyclus sp. CXY001]|uniref:nucleotidyltransferase family protein n=1 Tax=Pseudoroseicyclus sp. CXY001 TaxID=3242492 RepID=UPI00358DBD3B